MSDAPSWLDELVSANEAFASKFDRRHRPVRPLRRLVVVTCMDARIDVFAALGLELGDAHVIRNAGGLASDDVIRSLCLSQRALGTREIVLVHHTDCGLEGLDDDAFTADLEGEVGSAPGWRPGGFADAASDVVRCLATIRNSPFLPHRDRVAGFVYDVDTGRLHPVG